MSNRFTDRAQRVIIIAQEVAKRCPHDSVEAAHILAALVGLGEGGGCQIVAERGLSQGFIKERALDRIPLGYGKALIGEIPFSAEAKKVLERAVEEAQKLGHSFVGTEHILLGLEHIDSTAALLKERGLTLENVREEVIKLFGKGEPINESSSGVLGHQLMAIAITRDVSGVLLTTAPGKIEPAIVILLDEGADIERTYNSLRAVLPKIRNLCFKKPNQHAVSWIDGKWKENTESERTLTF